MPSNDVLDRWYERVTANPARIVLPEGKDPRVQEAAEILRSEGLADPIVITDPAEFVDDRIHDMNAALRKLVDLSDPLQVAVLMVAAGDADGCVAGATHPTAEVIRAGLRVLGVNAQSSVVSSCFFFVFPDGKHVVYGDCGVVPDPDPDQLASIAISSSDTFEQLTGEDAKVAMLSFSTKGSAAHEKVDKVLAATRIVKQRRPRLAVDGELQFDAAWVPKIAQAKAPSSAVAGKANVFVFPNLDAGNIAYKITERLAGAQAFGPLLQGLNGVLHDLSRGCTAYDIVNVAVIASLQAQARKAS
jgi:phosphotransacetylase